MNYETMDRLREEIESWVSLVGKKRVEERLKIVIYGLEEKEHHSVIYE